MKVIQISRLDNVAVALHPIKKGEEVTAGGITVTALEDIPQGHKIALKPIKNGENIIQLENQVGNLLPKALYSDNVLDSVSCFTTTQIAKELGITAQELIIPASATVAAAKKAATADKKIRTKVTFTPRL